MCCRAAASSHDAQECDQCCDSNRCRERSTVAEQSFDVASLTGRARYAEAPADAGEIELVVVELLLPDDVLPGRTGQPFSSKVSPPLPCWPFGGVPKSLPACGR